MWNGEVTEELRALARQYANKFEGRGPHHYDDIAYGALTCEEFVVLIKVALERGVEIPQLFRKG